MARREPAAAILIQAEHNNSGPDSVRPASLTTALQSAVVAVATKSSNGTRMRTKHDTTKAHQLVVTTQVERDRKTIPRRVCSAVKSCRSVSGLNEPSDGSFARQALLKSSGKLQLPTGADEYLPATTTLLHCTSSHTHSIGAGGSPMVSVAASNEREQVAP